MPLHDILSPELLEEIFIHTLDYSHKLNNRQLKRLQLVSKLFDQVATRILYRWIVCETSWSVNRLFLVIMRKKKRLGPLVRSITNSVYHGVSQDQEALLLEATPLCSAYRASRTTTVKIGTDGSYSPRFPTSERLVVIDSPTIARPDRPQPPNSRPRPTWRREDGEDTYDENGKVIPRVKPNAAIAHLSTLPCSIKHLTLVGKQILDFQGTEVDKLPLDQLATIQIRQCKGFSKEWIEAIITPSIQKETLKSLELHDMEWEALLGIYIPLAAYGTNLRELTMIGLSFCDLDENMEENVFRGLSGLETLTISRRDSPIKWSNFPPNLRNLVIREHTSLGSELTDLTDHLLSGTQPRLESLAFQTDSSWQDSYSPSFPLTDHPPSSTSSVNLTRLRFENIEIKDPIALDKLINISSSSLRYLAFHDLGITNPWDSIALCTSLRWLELGTIRKMMCDYGEDDSDDEEAQARKLRRLSYAQRRRRATKFLSATFPHLDYVFLHMGDSFTLLDTAATIFANRWPALKVLDLGGMDRSGIYENETQEEMNARGIEDIFMLARQRGFTVATEGSALNGLGDLWRKTLSDKGWNDED